MKKKLHFLTLVIIIALMTSGCESTTANYVYKSITGNDTCPTLTLIEKTAENLGFQTKDKTKSEDIISLEEAIENAKPKGFTLIAAGDILFHTPQVKAATKKDGHYDFKPCFSELPPIVEKGVSIACYETTVTKGKATGYPMFKTPAASLDGVRFAGFDLLTLANNHSADGGIDGLIRTYNAVKERGMIPLGTYLDNDTRPVIININGRDIAFLNYTYAINGMDSVLGNKQYMVNRINEKKILEDIAYAKERTQGIIAMMHWGTEYRTTPNREQKRLAKLMAEKGVDIILGSHPHVIEPDCFIETEGHKTYCIFSMGNFLSNQRREYFEGRATSEDGMMVELKVKFRDDNRIEVEEVTHHPIWVKKTQNPLSYKIIPINRALEGLVNGITESDKKQLQQSKDRTMKIMNQEVKFD